MGRNIGQLGRERDPIDLEFTYFDGETIRVHPQASDQVEIEFLEAGRDIDVEALEKLDLATLRAMDEAQQAELMRTMNKAQRAGFKALMTSLRQLIHPDDFDRYWSLGVKHGQQLGDRMADIRAITDAVLEATTDFPPPQRAGSPRGPETTPVSSGVVSSSPEHLPKDLVAALALERGRPDIQEFFVQEHESRVEREREAAESAERDRRRLADAGLPPG
jgi:hypothetical protein